MGRSRSPRLGLAIEQRPKEPGASDTRARWGFRASSGRHLRRWTDAARIPPAAVTHPDGEHTVRYDQGEST